MQRLVEADVVAPVEADVLEGGGDELLGGVRLARRDDVVVRLVGLKHQPHRPHVVAGEAPVPLGREVASLSSCSSPRLIAAAPRLTFRVRKCSGRRGDSWLKRIADDACRP